MAVIPSLEVRTAPANAADTQIFAAFASAAGSKSTKGASKGRASAYPAELVERLAKDDVFAGKAGQLQFVRFGGAGAGHVMLVGFGAGGELTADKARTAGGNVYARLKGEKVRAASVDVSSFGQRPSVEVLRAFAEGLVLGAYSFDKYRTKGDAGAPKNGAMGSKSPKSAAKAPASENGAYDGVARITFVSGDRGLRTKLERELAQAQATGLAANITRDWSNEPSNYGTPEFYAEEAKRLAKAHGLKITVLGKRETERERMGLFNAVGQGSAREGRVVIVEYNPKGAKKTVALVGKGVTFDSGGISIKPSMRMEEMKHDMTGAATVMGAVVLAAQWKVPNRVIGIMGFTENMPSGNAVQPGNVITSRAGKTVEIINTDAEGRLVLADILDYVQDMNPDAVVDIATLTGAVAIALGKQCCAILGNDDRLIESVRKAGAANGERIWQLPLFDEYMDDLRSDWADMKNSANDSYGGTIRGAIFLKQFIRKGVRWAHLDIAATGAHVSHISYFPKRGATGAYVRTLARFAADFK